MYGMYELLVPMARPQSELAARPLAFEAWMDAFVLSRTFEGALQIIRACCGSAYAPNLGSGMPRTPRPWIANRLPRMTPSPG